MTNVDITFYYFTFKVVIGDNDGVVTCFGMKKGEAVVGNFSM